MEIYNCEITFSEGVDSLLTQTFNDFELIMCDDGSADERCNMAKQYADK
jgi:glycosyltransferase EpsE